MADIKLVWNPAIQYADWVIEDGTIASGDDLETAVIFSLFTWRRDIPYGYFGWWGDTYETTGQTGSRLPEMIRAYYNSEASLILRLNDIIAECLQWLIDANVVASFDIVSNFTSRSAVASTITAHKPDNTTQVFSYSWAWNQLIS